MILLNLLPHREEAKLRRKANFNAALFLAILTGVMLAALVYLALQQRIDRQNARNQMLQTEITKLDSEIKEISTLQAEITALKARQKTVEDLQMDRNLPVHLMNELVRQLPTGVYLTSIKQEATGILINGVAQSNDRVSQLLYNLTNGSEWLSKPELVEVVAANVTLSAKDVRRVANFSLRAQLKRPDPTKTGPTNGPGTTPSAAGGKP